MSEIDPNLPVDKSAALVVSKSKDHGSDFEKQNKITSMVPLPTMLWPYGPDHDLTGRRCGRFTVIGYSVWRPKSHQPNNTRWVVRCACGRYQIMTTKAIKKAHPENACVECYKLITQRKYMHRQLNKNLETKHAII